MLLSLAEKNIHVSPSIREQSGDSAGLSLSQIGYCEHEQILDNRQDLIEMTGVDYSHLQHLIQAHMEAQTGLPDGPDARHHPSPVMVTDETGSVMISPFTSAQAIDLSTTNEAHSLVMPLEKTPVSYGDVPGFVLARLGGIESPAGPLTKDRTSSQIRSRSTARVCLEKRFKTLPVKTSTQEDGQSAVFTSFLTMLKKSVEAKEKVMQPQKQWLKSDRGNTFEVSSSHVEGVYGPVTNTHGQVIIPKSCCNFHPDRAVTKAHHNVSINPAEKQHLVNIEKDVVTPAAFWNHCSAQCSQPIAAKVAQDSAGESQSSMRKNKCCLSLSQRKERHNSKERERRKRIRLCCDELNTLVPFCDLHTDKVTTLKWTIAFLRYINKTYGDTFKEEFVKVFAHKQGLFLKSGSAEGENPICHRMDETLSNIPLAAEQ